MELPGIAQPLGRVEKVYPKLLTLARQGELKDPHTLELNALSADLQPLREAQAALQVQLDGLQLMR